MNTQQEKLDLQRENTHDLNNERVHIENIFNSRFNYFILFFTLFISIEIAILIADTLTAKTKISLICILSIVGTCISSLIWYTLVVVYKRLEIILKEKDKYSYISTLIYKEKARCAQLSSNYVLGWIIPLISTVCMFVSFVISVYCAVMH